jgi:hypothetical protein
MMDLDTNAQDLKEKHEQLLQSFEITKRARKLTLPTADADVRVMLRSLEHPITLFGEGVSIACTCTLYCFLANK